MLQLFDAMRRGLPLCGMAVFAHSAKWNGNSDIILTLKVSLFNFLLPN